MQLRHTTACGAESCGGAAGAWERRQERAREKMPFAPTDRPTDGQLGNSIRSPITLMIPAWRSSSSNKVLTETKHKRPRARPVIYTLLRFFSTYGGCVCAADAEMQWRLCALHAHSPHALLNLLFTTAPRKFSRRIAFLFYECSSGTNFFGEMSWSHNLFERFNFNQN